MIAVQAKSMQCVGSKPFVIVANYCIHWLSKGSTGKIQCHYCVVVFFSMQNIYSTRDMLVPIKKKRVVKLCAWIGIIFFVYDDLFHGIGDTCILVWRSFPFKSQSVSCNKIALLWLRANITG